MLFYSQYKLKIVKTGTIRHYLLVFKDCEGIPRKLEVKRSMFREFRRLKNIERKMTRWNERHVEAYELPDEALRERMVKPPKSLEDEIFDNERDKQLRLEIQKLPEIQRRRFLLHHEFGLTYEQIGEIEGRHLTAIRESVLSAEEKVKKGLKKFEN